MITKNSVLKVQNLVVNHGPLSQTLIYSKYARVIPLKDKKGITITNGFQKILKESNRKPNKIWVVNGRNFIIDQ